jgi:peptidoglycan-associated lipoprotein
LQFLGAVSIFALIGCAHPKAQVKQSSSAGSPGTISKESGATRAHADSSDDKLGSCGDVKIHFAFNTADIEDADKPALEQAAGCLKTDKKLHVTIEGNADERGTEEYNLALGDRRAHAVATWLERLGANGLQLRTVSYGKEQPVCTQHDENCWAQNRRANVKLNK